MNMAGSAGRWREGRVKRKKETISRIGRRQGLFRSTLSLILLTSLVSFAEASMFSVCKVLRMCDSPSYEGKRNPLCLPLPFPPLHPPPSPGWGRGRGWGGGGGAEIAEIEGHAGNGLNINWWFNWHGLVDFLVVPWGLWFSLSYSTPLRDMRPLFPLRPPHL